MTRARILTIVGIALLGAGAALAIFLTRAPRTALEAGEARDFVPAATGRQSAHSTERPIASASASTNDSSDSRSARQVVATLDPNQKSGLLLRDRLSGCPLIHTTIRTSDDTLLGVTNSIGLLALPTNDIDLMTAPLWASIDWDRQTDRVPLDANRQKYGLLVDATIAATARLEVRVRPPELAPRTMVRAFELPPLPPEDEFTATRPAEERARAKDFAALERRASPENFRWHLARILRDHNQVTVANPEPHTNRFLIDIPRGGDWVVDLSAGAEARAREIVHIDRGEEKSIDVELAPRAVVTGILLNADATPCANHQLSVCVSSNAKVCHPLPVDDDNRTDVRVDESGGLMYRVEAPTDSEGRFHFVLPFTDDVSLFGLDASPEHGPSVATLHRKLGSAMDAWRDVELRLAAVPRRIHIQITNRNETPRGPGTLTMYGHVTGTPKHQPFSIATPIDANGWCDLSFASAVEDELCVSATFEDKSSTGTNYLQVDDERLIDGGKFYLR
jgi:hypothetical protein